MNLKLALNRCKLLVSYVLLSFVFLCGCTEKKGEKFSSLKEPNNYFNEYFTLIDSISINKSDIEKYNILSVDKISDIGRGRLVFLDVYAQKLYLIDSTGSVVKIIAKEGNGPGEFLVISDFTLDNNGNLFVLGWQKKIVGKFDQNMNFVESYSLSFSHGFIWRIYSNNDKYYIAAHKKLSTNSTRNDYSFLPYNEHCLINTYSKIFDYEGSFFNLAPELERTEAAFLRPRSGYALLAFHNNRIYGISEEGFYKITVFDENGSFEKEYKIKNNKFKEFDLNRVREIDFSKKNQPLKISEEERGKIMVDFSYPTNFEIINDLLYVVIAEPTSNYYREFQTEDVDKVEIKQISVFQIEENNLKLLVESIETTKKMIGSNKKSLFFLNENNSENVNEIVIYKYIYK